MRFKRKIPTFIFGLSIGLIIGLGFFVFKINDVFNKLKESNKGQVTIIQQPVKNVKMDADKQRNNKDRFKINLKRSTKIDYIEVDSLITEEDQLTIAKEELLSVKSIKVIKIGVASNSSDSLAANLANVKENGSDLYFVEFWKTPLNSKGYRFTKNKIMLYGFMDSSNLLLYELENSFYIKSSDQVYRLFYGGDFKQLERIVDTELLAKIN